MTRMALTAGAEQRKRSATLWPRFGLLLMWAMRNAR